jgi:hypothetical protein
MRAVLRSALLALLLSLAAGFALGTCWRQRAERPTVYIGRAEGAPPGPAPVGSSGPGLQDRYECHTHSV